VVAGRVVVGVSAPARAAGIRAGLHQREAEDRCPGLAVHPRDEATERRAFEVVVSALETFGVPVTLDSPGWAAMATRGPSRRLGGEAGLVGAVAAALGRVGLPADGGGHLEARWWRIGVADGRFAAFLAAARGEVVERGGNAAFLAPLPVEDLGHGELAGILRRLGIETLGSFAALDPSAVLSRFGTEGAALQRLAAGGEGTGLSGRPPRRPEQVGKEMDPPDARLETALFVARGLADELGRSLGRRGLSCTLLGIEVELSDGSRLERRWSGRGSGAPSLVAERLRSQLEAWASSGRPEGQLGERAAAVGVAAVRLVALEVAPEGGEQLSLWGRRRPADEERITRVVARVQGMLGPASVLRPATGGGRGPRERVRLLPFGEELDGEGSSSSPPPPWPGRLPAPSPAVVPSASLAAEVRDAGGLPLAVDAR
jgi:protein ImuB